MVRIFLICLIATPALAETVYKTVEEGVTTFSDVPPAHGQAEVLTVDVPETSNDGLLEERLAAMRETTDRMAADRREREQHRAELRSARRSEMEVPQPAPQPVTVAGTWGYWPNLGYPRPPYRPGRPGIKPIRPLPTPAPPPGWSVMQPGNSQLMRPIVSSRN